MVKQRFLQESGSPTRSRLVSSIPVVASDVPQVTIMKETRPTVPNLARFYPSIFSVLVASGMCRNSGVSYQDEPSLSHHYLPAVCLIDSEHITTNISCFSTVPTPETGPDTHISHCTPSSSILLKDPILENISAPKLT